MISVLIPTTNRDTLSIVLSNAIVPSVGEIIILDSGEIPVISRDDIMIIGEVAQRNGISFKIIREQAGIGKARFRLMQEASFEFSLMMDDDVWLAQEDVNRLKQAMRLHGKGFVVPCCLIAADFLGVKNLHREAITVPEAQKLAVGDWQMPYFNYKKKQDLYVPIKFSGTQCLMFNTSDSYKAPLLESWKDGMNREDIYLTKALGPGQLCTQIQTWHMETKRQKREWQNRDEELGYNKVISGDLEGYLK